MINPSKMKRRLIVGVSGASGIIYAITLLKILKECDVESHLVVSRSALLTLTYETKYNFDQLKLFADFCYNNNNIGATIASGSFLTMGMIVVPCSIHTMSAINVGITNRLITRAADVILKERRKLVLMIRETPLHLGHLRTMLSITELGAIIFPPVPSFYTNPQNITELVEQTAYRALDLFSIHSDKAQRWNQ